MNARHDKQFGVYKGKQSMCTSTMTFNSPPDRILPWIMVIGGLAIREILFFPPHPLLVPVLRTYADRFKKTRRNFLDMEINN